MSDRNPNGRTGPSRAKCEEIIRRILLTELAENGENKHFRTAADFMSYFESLYPAGGALVKQVQRAIRSLDLAKDERGYFIIDKTKTEQSKEKEIAAAFERTNARMSSVFETETLFLETDKAFKSYLIELIADCESFKRLYLTMIETAEGILFLTEDRMRLAEKIDSLMPRAKE